MPADHVTQPWTMRSALVAVADLDRSVTFYRELGPFDVLLHEDDVALLGETSPESFALILRQVSSVYPARHGQQSLGLRFITFNVGPHSELDRIQSLLQKSGHFTERRSIADGESEVVLGRDPDNLPLVFAYYAEDTLGPDHLRTIADVVFSVDA